MKKFLSIILVFLMTIMVVPIQSIKANESELSIPIEIAEKLSTYVTTPGNPDIFDAMDEEDVVVIIDNYKITRGDYIKLNDTTYVIDVTKITEDDYIVSNARATTVYNVNLGYNAVGAAYKSATVAYDYSNSAGYTQQNKRRYVTSNQIRNYFKNDYSPSQAWAAAKELYSVMKSMGAVVVSSLTNFAGVPASIASLLVDTSDFEDAFNNYTKVMAFRNYMSAGYGGYLEEIYSINGNDADNYYTDVTRGYGSWSGSTIEFRREDGGASGQTVVTFAEKYVAG